MAGKKESQLLFYSLWGTSVWFDSTGVIWWDINDGNQQQIQMELHFQLCVDGQVHADDGGVDDDGVDDDGDGNGGVDADCNEDDGVDDDVSDEQSCMARLQPRACLH